MIEAETELVMAQRHLAQAERNIAAQKLRLAGLEALDAEVDLARQLLAAFEQTRFLAIEHVERLQSGSTTAD